MELWRPVSFDRLEKRLPTCMSFLSHLKRNYPRKICWHQGRTIKGGRWKKIISWRLLPVTCGGMHLFWQIDQFKNICWRNKVINKTRSISGQFWWCHPHLEYSTVRASTILSGCICSSTIYIEMTAHIENRQTLDI